MLTNIVAHSPAQAGMLRNHTSSRRVLRPGSAALLKSRHRQQTRAYRFDIWSSYLGPEFQRDLRRRHRMLKHKYAESLNRKMKWDHEHLAEDPQAILQRVMGRYWHPTNPCHSSRCVNEDGSPSWYSRTFSGEGANNGRVYTSTNPIFGNEFDTWRSDLNDIVKTWTKQATKGAKRANSTSSSGSKRNRKEATVDTSQAEEEYVIDPITNRKVLKKSYGLVENTSDDSAGTFKSYRSQFAMFAPPNVNGPPQQAPVHSNGPPPPEELTKYNDVEIDPNQDSTAQSEEYSLNHLPPEEAAEVYKNIDTYRPTQYDEIQSTAAIETEKYEDLDKYKPSAYDQIQSTSETHTEKYEDLHKYNPSQYDTVQSIPENPAQEYKDLHEYKAYRYKESSARETETSPAYDDLQSYRPYMHNETVSSPNTARKYADLDKYDKFEHDREVGYGEVAKQYEDLDKYNPSEFLDQAKAEDPKPAYEDLDKYDQPFLHQEGKIASYSDHSYDDLGSYRPKEFDDHTSGEMEAPFQQYGDLNKYKAFRFQEPTDNVVLEQDVVAASLKDFDSKSEARQSLEQSLSDHIAASDAADREASANVQKSRQISKDPENPMTGNFVRDFPEEFSTRWGSTATGLRQEHSTSVLGAQYEQEVQSSVQSAEKTYSDNLSTAANSSVLQPALDRQPKSKIESALNRTKRSMSHQQRPQTEAYDPFSKHPQGLETSYVDECGSESSKTPYIRMYGTMDKAAEDEVSKPASAISIEQLVQEIPTTTYATTPNTESTLYKILAYDPTMQNVTIAETSSVVPDQANPLTPAEVLLRLSHPAKFFPHFAPLQAQGFEIVSGSGDVLVFRKVRNATESSGNSQAAPVNPIDMMGKPAPLPNAAGFASPTGFVNYDTPTAEERSPPFQSNIDVRREEPVFSGTRNAQADARKQKKRSVTKRVLIGGAWIAGLSYALGVIGEYFVTGGIDGKGPTGF